MELSNTCCALDLEHMNGIVIEIGITTINIPSREILKTYSIPLKPIDPCTGEPFEVSKHIKDLTGWTTAKLNKQGVSREEAIRRLRTYGMANRLIVTDMDDEVRLLEENLEEDFSQSRLNVSTLLFTFKGQSCKLGLVKMLDVFGMTFEGRQHRAADDSFNIARVFTALLKERDLPVIRKVC